MKKITREFLETLGIEESKILEILLEQEDKKFSFLGVLRGKKEHEKEVSDFKARLPFFKTENSKHLKDLKKVGYEYKKVNDMYYFFIIGGFKKLETEEQEPKLEKTEKVGSSILEHSEIIKNISEGAEEFRKNIKDDEFKDREVRKIFRFVRIFNKMLAVGEDRTEEVLKAYNLTTFKRLYNQSSESLLEIYREILAKKENSK